MKKIMLFLIALMMLQIAISQTVQLNIKVFIEGPYYNGQMTPFLNVLGHLPTSQPYNTAPWNYPGTESVTSFPSSNIVDWVLVDVLKPHTDGNQIRFEVMGRKAGFLFKDGYIKDMNGTSSLSIETEIASGFYIHIHHRNHLSVISAVPLVESAGVFTYDFTLSADQALGGTLSQKQLSTVIWGMIAADANASGQIDNRDKNEVWLPQQGLTGYYEGDFNMDTQVDMDDKVVKWEPNAGKSAFPVKDTVITPASWTCGDTIIDSRDGQTYNTVQIGDQCWMAENLNIGTMINGDFDMANNGVIEKYCYGNNTTNCDTYGGLYQWDEMMQYSTTPGIQGICPTGWHLPTDTEYCSLTQFIDPTVVCNATDWSGIDAGTKMKSTSGWNAGGNGTNTSGFTALPGGYRGHDGNFYFLGDGDIFWSSTEFDTDNAWSRNLTYDNTKVYRNFYLKLDGFSVRCIKDNPPSTWSCGDPLIDTRDGQNYNTVQIGEQCWMAENLNIGIMIPSANNMENNSIIEKYCYDNNTDNCDTYGGLYQWNEMMTYITQEGSQGICPTGWHMPTNGEWTALSDFLGGESVAGGKMKEVGTIHWLPPNTGATNSSGFSAYAGGNRNLSGNFGNLGTLAFFWSSTEIDADNSLYRYIYNSSVNVGNSSDGKNHGSSVRCIKDSPPTWSCGDPLNDTRDGQTYNTVQIGDQCWMAENLNVGTMIQGTIAMTDNTIIEKYCYDNNNTNCETYGALYQWNEVMQYITQVNTIGICPEGWHFPTDAEYSFLSVSLGGDNIAGSKMKTTGTIEAGTGFWYAPNTGATNESGFAALPGGVRNIDGSFYGLGYWATVWSSTEDSPSLAWGRTLGYFGTDFYRDNDSKNYGFSVRCLKDSPPPTWSCGDPLNDTRDGQNFSTVQIGTQCWMQENLNIGTRINSTAEQTDNAILEKYCVDNIESNCDVYGGLYEWNELMQYVTTEGTKGICPEGWHLPTDLEWTMLTDFLGGESIAGGKMKSTGTINAGTGLWYEPNNDATNESGFTALPGSYRLWEGSFVALGYIATFWSSTQSSANKAWYRGLFGGSPIVLIDSINNYFGCSVRCIKDTPPTWSCGDVLNDTRDNQTYNTVQIGTQCWMAENLNVGTMVPGGYNMSNNDIIEKHCYNNNSYNCNNYGGLYSWEEMMDYESSAPGYQQGLCPIGWHLPTDDEWCTMTQFIDPTVNCSFIGFSGNDISTKMKSTYGWYAGGNGTNSSGFNALPTGCRCGGSFANLNYETYFWSTSQFTPGWSWMRGLTNNYVEANRNYQFWTQSFSVRCIKD